jgi:hypothetical protein
MFAGRRSEIVTNIRSSAVIPAGVAVEASWLHTDIDTGQKVIATISRRSSASASRSNLPG